MADRWHVVENDEIGGWSIATADVPTSQIGLHPEAWEVARFVREEDARRAADLYNAAGSLARTGPMLQVVADEGPCTDWRGYDAGGYHVYWDLSEECRLSFGRDGDGGPWIVYLGMGGGCADIYCVVQPEHIIDLGPQLAKLVGDNGGLDDDD